MEIKNHDLKTIQDIINVVDENNIEYFLEDFRMFLVDVVKTKLLVKAVSAQCDVDASGLVGDSFNWIEDGKHDNHGTFLTVSDEKDSVTVDVNDITQKIQKLFKE